MTHICIGKLTINGSNNGLSPGRREAIISTNAGILLFGPLGTIFSEILIGIQNFSFKMHLKMSSAKWLPFCLGLNVLRKLYIPKRLTVGYIDRIIEAVIIQYYHKHYIFLHGYDQAKISALFKHVNSSHI